MSFEGPNDYWLTGPEFHVQLFFCLFAGTLATTRKAILLHILRQNILDSFYLPPMLLQSTLGTLFVGFEP